MIGRDYEARIKTKTAQLHAIWVSIHSGYEESKVGLTHTQEAEVQAAPLQSELRHSLENKDLTDYEVADFILRKLATLEALPRRKTLQLVDVVLENVETLYPLAESVGRFFISLGTLPTATKHRVARALLKPFVKAKAPQPPDFYTMWILNIFAESTGWNHADVILKLYRDAHSDVVKRYAALALANNGKRFHALEVIKEYESASPLLKTAILVCSRLLPADERSHWKKMVTVPGQLEKLL